MMPLLHLNMLMLAITMTTNNMQPNWPEVTSAEKRASDSLYATSAGFPDPMEIARLVNGMFRDSLSMDLSKEDVYQPPAEPVKQSSESGINGPSADTALVNEYGIPGGVMVSDYSSIPSFGFIETARVLFSGEPIKVPMPEASLSTIKNPAENSLETPIAPLAGVFNSPSVLEPKELDIPQVTGTVMHDLQRGRPVIYEFVDSARPMVSSGITPSLTPNKTMVSEPIRSSMAAPFDPMVVRRDFPILQERLSNGKPLIWLDNAATTQKPQTVIDRLVEFYRHENSNVHRAAHELAARSTDAYEAARKKVASFLKASSAEDVIFVRGATEGINFVAQSWGRHNIRQDDEIIITWLEHHANIVPWQQLASEKGARLRIAPVDDRGQLLLDEYERLFTPRTRLVALTHVSNALGTITPAAEMVGIAHRHGARVLVDGAQAVSHMPVDVQALDSDFYVFSGHKLFGPTGIGVVYGKPEVLAASPPWQGGGNMIADVTFEKTLYQAPPARFEAGTGNIADAAGLGVAIDYVSRLGMDNIARYEHNMLRYGTEGLQRIPGLRLIGTASEKAGVISFVLDGFSTEEVGNTLSQSGIAVRAGHHCAQPILRRLGVESTVRPSLAFYNTCEEIDALIAAIWSLKTGRKSGL